MAEKFRTMIGGQALIEGILMQGPRKRAIVVRKPDGELESKVMPYTPPAEKHKILGWPVIRGCVGLYLSLYHGVKALTYSAEFYPEDEAQAKEPSRFEKWLDKKLSSKNAEKIVTTLGIFIGVLLAVGLFFLLPTFIAGLIAENVESGFVKNLIEGAVRIFIFLGYIYGVSRLKDIKRVFSYHGAEHKTIFCYEAGEPLTVENARRFSRRHPRCGTSFLFVVMIISILVFSLVSWSNMALRFLLRLILIPVVVGVSYEINRFIGRRSGVLARILTAPGLWLQSITTVEPDDGMLEVGIESLKLVLPEEKGTDEW